MRGSLLLGVVYLPKTKGHMKTRCLHKTNYNAKVSEGVLAKRVWDLKRSRPK